MRVGSGRFVRLCRVGRSFFKQRPANGSSKRSTAASRCETIVGPNRSPLAACLLLKWSKNDLGIKAMHREALEQTKLMGLREPAEAYARKLIGRNEALSSENTLLWNESLETQVQA